MRSFIRSIRSALIRREWRRRFPSSVIHSGVAISADCSLGRHTVFFSGATLDSSDVGAYSYIQANTAIFNAEIGPFCSIASHVTIGLAAHPTSMVSTSPVFYDKGQPLPRFFTRGREFTDNLPRTRIGADVWIGQAAMIKAGVAIGVGAVIGAGALVTRDIAPYMIVGGVPCRPIRSRFSDDIVLRLRESRWWELAEEDLEALADTFLDPTEFLSAFAKRRVGDDRTAR